MPIIIKRIFAYILDILIVSLVSGLISNTVINPYYEDILNLNSEYQEKYDELKEKIDNLEDDEKDEKSKKIMDDFLPYYKESIKESTKLSLFDGCVTSTLLLLYFVIFAYYFGGETVGKRIMRIKIIRKDNSNVKMFNLLIRALILYGIPFTLLNILLSYTLNVNGYYVALRVIQTTQYVLEIVILSMCIISQDKRGLHDKLSGTKVVLNERN